MYCIYREPITSRVYSDPARVTLCDPCTSVLYKAISPLSKSRVRQTPTRAGGGRGVVNGSNLQRVQSEAQGLMSRCWYGPDEHLCYTISLLYHRLVLLIYISKEKETNRRNPGQHSRLMMLLY